MSTEQERIDNAAQGKELWELFGPYLSERAWGTVREDYSADGSAWDYFTHDAARSRTYRWNEDGLGGISDDKQWLCFALALWNGHDPILKERLFGLTGSQGNHGEDVKEMYYYLDSTPTHSYMKMLYKYPQAAFPYQQLVEENARRGKLEPEFELVDTGVFAENRYFDVFIEYAKNTPEDILARITVINRGPDPAPIHVLPTLWFRNTWSWGRDDHHPELSYHQVPNTDCPRLVKACHYVLGDYYFYGENSPEFLFTNNETNNAKVFGAKPSKVSVKDAFHDYIVEGKHSAVDPGGMGTKAAAHYSATLEPGASMVLRLRLTKSVTATENDGHDHLSAASTYLNPDALTPPLAHPFADFDQIFTLRLQEADEFYARLHGPTLDADTCNIQRQAFAGMLWSKQFYYYIVEQWLDGDPSQPVPPPQRKNQRNHEWRHLWNERVMSMPDKWEYPWYASWDLAFHCLPFALLDITFAKSQLDLLLREWYQHPNGQVPAYEWAFGDVNPPVYAWASWRIYKMEQKQNGKGDRPFLESVFHKLLINFTWWVNRKDSEGKNVFQGGFLGLDNIGVFDRSAPLPTGGHIEQSDGTSWMGMFCLNMMTISLELARTNPVYENIATKFFEHFLAIADAMNNLGGDGIALWNDDDEFFYDVLHETNDTDFPLKVRSLLGLIPLLAVETIEPDLLELMPGFRTRLEWYLTHRPDLARLVSRWQEPGMGERRLLALVRGRRMKHLLKRMLDPAEFLSDFGVRSISRYHLDNPYVLNTNSGTYTVNYEPAESQSGLFGGNSNWRGPIWFPINYLLIEALQKFHHYYGDDFKVECPTGSGHFLTLSEIADELSRRLISIFAKDSKGNRPYNGTNEMLQTDPQWKDYLLFHEYFHGDSGIGLGANHQTGWTGLVAKLIQQQGDKTNQF